MARARDTRVRSLVELVFGTRLGLHSAAQRVQRSLGDGSGSMAWLPNRIGAMLGLGQPAAASVPPCTSARARRPHGEDDGVEEGTQQRTVQNTWY